jgi:hypothetical protein
MRSIPPLALLVLLLAPFAARASDPSAIYSVPTRVEILPDDASGTRVVISGAFFFLKGGGTYAYDEPRCGYLSFQCPAGKELLCRMQWLDLRKAIGLPYCAGFGTLNTVSTATLHTDRGSLGAPDPWDLGIGITQGMYVDGKCAPALQRSCALALPDAGTPDAATAPPDSAATPPDLAPLADASAAVPDAPAGMDAVVAAPAKPSGCAFAGTGGGALPFLAVLLALLRRRR